MQPQRLVIPGRPQARLRNGHGERLDASADYLRAVRAVARTLTQPDGTPAIPAAALRLDVELTYTSDREVPPSQWHAQSIPNGDTAATLVLQALVGSLYTHASQANPLIVHRHVLTPLEATARWGAAAARGCTVIRWEPA